MPVGGFASKIAMRAIKSSRRYGDRRTFGITSGMPGIAGAAMLARSIGGVSVSMLKIAHADVEADRR